MAGKIKSMKVDNKNVKKAKSVESFRIAIKKVLENNNMYSPILDFAIEDLAQINYLKEQAFNDAQNFNFDDSDIANKNNKNVSVIIELSREGAARYKVNPAYEIFLNLVRESQKVLDGLLMTAKSANLIQGDEFDELRERMEAAANG